MEFVHVPVLLQEVLQYLEIRPDGIYADGTAGGAGHSLAIAKQLTPLGHLYAFDRDPDAVVTATERLAGYPATVIHANYDEMEHVLKEKGVSELDGVLMDLGVSSHQLDEASRGFSFHTDAPLDMRMSQTGMTAADLVNTAEESELSRILFTYGEERFARNIARKIVAAREIAPIRTTKELAEIILSGVPAQQRRAKNPCRQCFQAIRIAVNGEFEHLEAGLKAAFSMLKPGGRLAVITFHSLEDRIVKQQFAQWCRGCICPPDFPVCVCGRTPEAKLVVKKPVIPTPEEQERNSRSRSAKLRVIERSR
ncbi:16S rRNA (cytosine(1402)-N(4))-methyltransferase RsmH [uncultured Ruminococcus sp.]|uniref:16S rRNA (cytosine(1402)-N(4))-methyltransferase RsmH n=1 Tax=uncultured Ruminococcus sp. TaxID=165186 RepID=UPI0025F3FDBC|nr:16S rRNA (cytosine(1402)-N(4))-methyltransferase RsmH [uncultured Ruminococcus sp.]